MNPGAVSIAVATLLVGMMGTRLSNAACKDEPLGADCRKYGDDWKPLFASLPRFVTWGGVRSTSYSPSSGGPFDGNVESSPLAYNFRGNALGSHPLRSYGGDVGIAWFVVPYFYVGAELALGEGHSSASPFVANGLNVQPRDSLNMTDTVFGGVVGVRLPLGILSVRADLLAGGSWLSLDQYVTSGANQLTATSSAEALYLEPRVHADIWVTPFLTVGAFAGMPGLDPSATTFGLTMAAHVGAYDGRFTIF